MPGNGGMMLEEDLEPLRAPYHDDESGQDHTYDLLERWGIPLHSARALENAMLADLDSDVLGIGWWVDHLPLRQRVLISDHLVDAAAEIPRNVAEAKMHLSSYISCMRDSDDRLRYRAVPGGFELRRLDAPIDALSSELAEMHMAGLLRALGSVFDCLAAAIIGVAGLPLDVKKAQWTSVVSQLRKADGEPVDLDTMIAECGPAGWDTWTLQMRNTWVHRPRRMTLTFYAPVWQAGRKATVYLPSTPELSGAEALHSATKMGQELLSENAETTLGGAFESTVALTHQATDVLLELWHRRRSKPDLIVQPAKQWPSQWPPQSSAFGGYTPDAKKPQVRDGLMMVAEKVGGRWGAAAVHDDQRHRFREASD